MNVAPLPIVFSIPVFNALPARPAEPDRSVRTAIAGAPVADSSKTFSRPRTSHPLHGRRLNGEDLGVVGSGVSGEVHRFRIEGKEYIVKSMHGQADRAMFEKEVAAFRQLEPNSNVCGPEALAFVNGRPSMLFKPHTLPTTTIAERAASLPPNDQLAVLEVAARDVLKGLKHLHENGLVHGDVKPANTVIDPNTLDVKLIDLGHSTAASEADPRTGREVLRSRCGRTGDPDYVAPELEHPELGNRALSAGHTLQSVDVFAVGRMLQDWLVQADKRFEEVHGGRPADAMACVDPQVAKWMERRKRLGDVAARMVRTDAGKRPMVESALQGLTPASPSDRVQGRRVLGQLVAAEKAAKAAKQRAAAPSAT